MFNNSNINSNNITNANSFALADGNLALTIVEQLIGIPRSRLHAASQQSYVSCFQLLFIIPVLPKPHRLRLTRISLHDAPHLQHRTLGLQVQSSGCEKFIKLFSDPTAWKYGDASTAQIYLDVNETLLGDFAIQLFDYDMVGNTNKEINSQTSSNTRLSLSLQTKQESKNTVITKQTAHHNRQHIINNNIENKNDKAHQKSLVQGTINSLNAHKLISDNNSVITTGSIDKNDQIYANINQHNSNNKNSSTQEMR